jgi:hypothetical protein
MPKLRIFLSVFSLLIFVLSCSTSIKKTYVPAELQSKWPFICRQIKAELSLENPVIEKKIRPLTRQAENELLPKLDLKTVSFNGLEIRIPANFVQTNKTSDRRQRASSSIYEDEKGNVLSLSHEPDRPMPKASRYLLSHTDQGIAKASYWTRRIFGDVPSQMDLYHMGHKSGLKDLVCKKGSRNAFALAIALIQRSIHQNWDGNSFELLSHPQNETLFIKIGSFEDPDFQMRAEIKWLKNDHVYTMNLQSRDDALDLWERYFDEGFKTLNL